MVSSTNLHLTPTEEDYLKAIFKIAETEQKTVSTNSIAKHLKTSAASVTDMLKKLAEKSLIHYKPYHGVSLTSLGNQKATSLIRKHRLWEVFLVKKLKFKWNEIHEIAEQLEHIKSEELIMRLDNYLDNPKFDPHGDPIPNAQGKFTLRTQIPLCDLGEGSSGILIGVKENNDEFLQYLNAISVKLGTHFKVLERISFDKSFKVIIDHDEVVMIGEKASQCLLLKRAQ